MSTKSGTCPICGSEGTLYAQARDIEYFSTPEAFDYRLCSTCDLLFIDPVPADRLNEIYPDNYYSFVANESGKNLVTKFKEWLDKRSFRGFLSGIPGPRLNVLDVGGGSGWLSDLIRGIDSRVSKTQIVDLDPGAQAVAERHGHDYFCGRIEEFETSDRYNVILLLNLIEHVDDPVGVLRKAAGLLAPGGRIYIKTPNFRAWDARIFRHGSWGGYHCPRHFVLFSRKSFRTAAQMAGLDVIDFSYTQGAPFWSVSMLDALRRAGIATVSAERPAVYHPIMPLLQAAGAALDFARKPFFPLSQMIVHLGKP
ncbi:methyltransferase [Pseudoxanthomonas broegbernensis]|uniref:Methyltransferase n=1 Tax=Pseudoxanthomonas broegbernensis TaxID=83619 RepID=A0A7V8K698_9GAMM|nr:class I SAM-dependent methyltransferase [Pseudoxanthomonas broegbernensis]KAF1684806.1 methyltransferase [Pseudoxanthomonas broegbernensis]MBB6066336.1 SAM-dependent methyltransferase [Pseudoxanthomonas broegbernensis]